VLRDTEQGDSTAFNALYFFSLHRLKTTKFPMGFGNDKGS